MSVVLEFLPEAAAEVEAATGFYEQRVPGLGARFRTELMSVCSAVVKQPLLWRERPGGFRRALTFLDFHFTWPISFAASGSWSQRLDTPAAIQITGSNVNLEFNRTLDLAMQTRMPSPITGGCYCGKVRFRVSGPTLHQSNCHCANCRRAAGAQSVAWITVTLSAFAWEKGEPKRYKTDTGAYRTFCDACGTSLTYENDENPNEIDITTGSLDDPEHFPPNRDVFPEEKISWVRLIDGSFRHP